ncbi:MAG: PilZ domain-containing protein [Endomicrobiaceae bacterium]|jgi:Tfp pilus assembly protein PilZ|nr:PilZ domain-containing protein [Endomicrobiaceae bacterium]
MNIFDEKRSNQRKLTSLYTNILSVGSQDVIGECLMTDVCEYGFAIETEQKFSIKQKILLKISLLNEVVFLAGEIVRFDKGYLYPLYGVKICEEDSKNLNIFREYINYHL